MEKLNFTTTKANSVNGLIINELSLCLECRLLKIVDEELYLAEIVNVNVDESILDEKGNVSLEKLIPIRYDASTHRYYKAEDGLGIFL